jgi:uncharacterized protein (DUF433 family)
MTSEVEPRIVADPAIMMGKPTIEGTRITVEHILRMFAAGHAEETADSLSDWRVMAAE